MYRSRKIGVDFNADGIATIRIWAPLANEVAIRLNTYKADLPLDSAGFGYWELITSIIQPGDQYKIMLDGSKELPDPASLAQAEGVHGASEAVDLNDFEWTDDAWQNPALEDYLIYELHTGTFTPAGTFKGIIDKLDHLIELGITAIEIMPVSQFPGNRNWGYDGVFPYAVQNTYGGYKGLMRLIDACHNKGLAVILDVVYNHLGPEGNYFAEFGPYFTDKYHTPWGNAINFDDAWCDGVRRYYMENALMWFRDFHVDALRLDAVHAIKDFSTKHILQEIKEETDKLMSATGRKHYLLVELDLNDHRFIDPIDKGGYGMDGQWIDEFHHALRVTAGGERNGYYSDFEGIADLAKSYKDAYVYDGIYSPHRLKFFGNNPRENPGQQFIVFSQNHDQIGNRMLGERSSMLFSFEMQKLMAGAVMVSPYVPLLFMGEEWSARSPFQYFVSHSDPNLVEAVRKGRRDEFAAFHSGQDAPDPQSEETFERSRLNWGEISTEEGRLMLDYYKTLIGLRKQLPALRNPDRKNVEVAFNEEQQTLMLKRWYEPQQVCCLMNFSEKEQEMELPEGKSWKKKMDSADPRWKGPGLSPDTGSDPTKVKIQPQSLIIYTSQYV
ncbi:MAG: maltooligosyltrehalose trehalohydrolase [Mucilaginibacter sp.]|nr:maltooligosyltrehalose trehalohydrolase [Mucilaginibacter sp.]